MQKEHTSSFGERLRHFRLRAGLSQEALAERAGLTAAGVAALERGVRRSPYPQTFGVLADALALSSDERSALATAVDQAAVSRGHKRSASTTLPPAAPQTRLPVPLTSLLGREAEVAHVSALLHAPTSPARLVTLVGPGGVGKTRLALAAATGLASAYTDGAVFVDLAPLGDHRLVPATIARALEVRESGGRSALELLRVHLRERQMLLLLDNFEHVLGAAPLLSQLLETCPRLALLATSRAVLHLRGERRVAIEPLTAPPERVRSVEAIAAAPAVQLFVERARAVAPDFALTVANAAAVAAVCRRLDGLPLAIELAAARSALLQPAMLLHRLERSLPVLTRGPVDLPERQKTVRHTLAWSYDLLGPAEQVLFRCLAVFVGGCTLEAVEAVCADAQPPAGDMLDRLEALIDSSLLRCVDQGDGVQRFEMLETIREHALERLQAAGHETSVRNQHLAFFLALAETIELHLHGPDQAAWADCLEREHVNLRAALAWAGRSAQPLLGLRLATTLRYFWYMNGHHREGRDRLLEALERAEGSATTQARGRALGALGYLEAMRGDYALAWTHLQDALALGRQMQDVEAIVFAGRYLGFVALAQGDHDTARLHLEESFALYQELGNDTDAGAFLMYLGDAALAAADHERARHLFEESCIRLRRLGNTTVLPYPLRRLGHLALIQGDTERAAHLCLDSLRYNREVGDLQGLAACLVALAAVAAATQHAVRAVRLLSAADALLNSIDTQLFATDDEHYHATLGLVCEQLDPATFTAAWTDGQQLDLDAALAEAAASRMPPAEAHGGLTDIARSTGIGVGGDWQTTVK